MSWQSRNRKMENRKFTTQPIASEDLNWLLDLRGKVSEYLGDNDIFGTEGQKEWLDKIKTDPSVRYFIVKLVEKVGADTKVGMIRITHLDRVNRSACVGGDIHPQFQGKGYGVTMMEFIKNYCFTVLNLRRLWLFVLETNDRARHIYEKVGFQAEGVQKEAIWRDGKYIDYVMMSFIRREPK